MDEAGTQGQLLYFRNWAVVAGCWTLVGRRKCVCWMGQMRDGKDFHKSELAALFMTVIPHISWRFVQNQLYFVPFVVFVLLVILGISSSCSTTKST